MHAAQRLGCGGSPCLHRPPQAIASRQQQVGRRPTSSTSAQDVMWMPINQPRVSTPCACARGRQGRAPHGRGDTCLARSGTARGGAAGTSASSSAGKAPQRHVVAEPSTALLLAYFASTNRSLFAAQCIVEALIALYQEGRGFSEVQLNLKMSTQAFRAAATARPPPQQQQQQQQGQAPGSDTLESENDDVPEAPPLLSPQEEDILASWVALVLLTLSELRVPRESAAGGAAEQPAASGAGGESSSGGGAVMAEGNSYLQGMLGYVQQTLTMYDEGQTLQRLAGLQSLVSQDQLDQEGRSPFLQLMQQYTRLVLLTVEVVSAMGLTADRQLQPPTAVALPCYYREGFQGACAPQATAGPLPDQAQAEAQAEEARREQAAEDAGGGGSSSSSSGGDGEVCSPRGLAVRLLVAFMGAVLGSSFSLRKFVEGVRLAYVQGIAADELLGLLDESQFMQSGGLVPVGLPPRMLRLGAEQPSVRAPPPPLINKQLFSTWVSISYMALAQMGLPHPAAARRTGWAWAGFGDMEEALGMDGFVANTLRRCAGAEPRLLDQAAAQAGRNSMQADDDAAAANAGAGPGSPSASASSSVEAAGASVRQADGDDAGAPPELPDIQLVRIEDELLPATSSAYVVMTQQVNLVRALYEDLLASVNPPPPAR